MRVLERTSSNGMKTQRLLERQDEEDALRDAAALGLPANEHGVKLVRDITALKAAPEVRLGLPRRR
jgi:hypothetical protein